MKWLMLFYLVLAVMLIISAIKDWWRSINERREYNEGVEDIVYILSDNTSIAAREFIRLSLGTKK